MRTSRDELLAAWTLSCVIAWGLREVGINIVADKLLQNPDPLFRFNTYSTLEMLSRIAQGSICILLVTARSLHKTFKEQYEDSQKN